MRKENKNLIILCAAVLFLGTGYLAYQNSLLKDEIASVKKEFADKKNELEAVISNLQKDLETAKIERNGWEERYNAEVSKITFLAVQVESIKGTVGILEKIKQTDLELLKKYSKIYFLNENYVPSSLVAIDAQYIFNPQKKLQIHAGVYGHLKNMLDVAKAEGINLSLLSASRSFYEQAGVKSAYSVTFGAGSANQFSADQGYSEHQLGTTVDFTSTNGEQFAGFDKLPAYEWLKNNAYKYGFILSYSKGNSYYIYEPWHWRFVGKQLAADLFAQNKNFYDMDQREIDTYLQFFFDK
ncbi:MAG: Peptidase M15B and M15C DD-carboxypeptidase VanY/endolysin [Parcubacteria group bacterium GW2011_GWA2_47_9]|nr:MAG: Peptidase M15B and M15C DD-carboxypeptidase VanY/endolysin [Parcubacteria group bacterium GW2011_GWA2_47_9]